MTGPTGGQIVVDTLQRAGVDTVFGINGAHVDSIYQAALDRGLRIVDVRHEMNAGHAAEGYARVRGALGVAVVTAGGGFTNVVTSIADAFLDRTPVLYITGSGPLGLDQTNDLQSGIDQVAIAAPITKWSHRVTRTDLLPRLLAQAIRIATSAPRGPVLLDIPWDVLRDEVDEETARVRYRVQEDASGVAPAAAIEQIRDLLASAERPVCIVGAEITRTRAGAEVQRLAEAAHLPLFADYDGLGAVLGSPRAVGLLQTLVSLPASEQPDAVLLLGIRFGLTTSGGSGSMIPTNARIVQIDPDARELGRLQSVEIGVTADPGRTAAALADAFSAAPPVAPRDGWAARLHDLARHRVASVEAGAVRDDRIHPFDAVRAVADSVPEGAVVVADGALTYLWLSETIASAPLSTYLCHGYLGSMGVGMGIAVGARTASADAPVLLVTGDGAVGYSLAEFDTMVRAQLPVVVVVLNNRAWGATLHAQSIVLGDERITNNRLENGSYSAVARALGADGYDVTDIADLRPAIDAALRSGRPACIDVQVSLDPIPPEERVLMGGLPF